MLWTVEAVEDLKKLALEGKSASHISAALGVGSRNAVIGKASRIGITLGGGRGPGRGTITARTARPQWAPARYDRPIADTRVSGAAVAHNLQVSRGNGAAAEKSFAVVEVGEMLRLRFEDIREATCRWPLGDPRSGDFAYCGLNPAGGQSYCAGHCQMAYRAPQARKAPAASRAISNW